LDSSCSQAGLQLRLVGERIGAERQTGGLSFREQHAPVSRMAELKPAQFAGLHPQSVAIELCELLGVRSSERKMMESSRQG